MNIIENVYNKLKNEDRSADNKDGLYLLVTIEYKGEYLYYCHYHKDNGTWFEHTDCFHNKAVINGDNDFNETTVLRLLDRSANIKTEWVTKDILKEVKVKTIQYNINEEMNSTDENVLKLIVEELKSNCGKIVEFQNYELTDDLLLVCAVSNDEDYYYLCIDENFEIYYYSCAERYKVIEDKIIIDKWEKILQKNNSLIRNVIEKELSSTIDIPFTDYSGLFNNN